METIRERSFKMKLNTMKHVGRSDHVMMGPVRLRQPNTHSTT